MVAEIVTKLNHRRSCLHTAENKSHLLLLPEQPRVNTSKQKPSVEEAGSHGEILHLLPRRKTAVQEIPAATLEETAVS